MTLRALYGHGFASDRNSHKALEIDAWLGARGIDCERLDLRRLDDPHAVDQNKYTQGSRYMRLSEMIELVRSKIAGPTLLIGSSLGGLTMFRAAETSEVPIAVVGLAPAFRLIENWRARSGQAVWQQWQQSGAMDYVDYATGGSFTLDFGFVQDAERADIDWPTVTANSFIVHGSRDDVVAVSLSRQFAQQNAMCELKEVDDDHRLANSLPAIFQLLERAIGSLRASI